MEQRVRICDIAEELGLSTATVSNVIHGKTNKVSDETVQRVTALLEERQFSLHGIVPKSSVSLSMTTKNMRDTRWMIFSLRPP